MKKRNLLPLCLSFAILLAAMPALTQEENSGWKSPRIVTPGTSANDCMISPPSDAIILFNGTDLSKFRSTSGGDASWTVSDGLLTVANKAGDIQTRMEFNDFQLHVEWRIPADITGSGQLRGNSEAHGAGPIVLQDHGFPVSFRNIWIREL